MLAGTKRKPGTARRRTNGLIGKTIVLTVLVVAANVIGNYALKRGLIDIGTVASWSPEPYIRAFGHPWVAFGVIVMICWLAARLALLSWADLSFVLPVTSFSYVLTDMVAAVYLDEHVNAVRWAGVCVITFGVALVAHTPPGTTRKRREPHL